MPHLRPNISAAFTSFSAYHTRFTPASSSLPSMTLSSAQRDRKGQSLMETLTGFLLLIPIALLSYDLTFILIANQNNEKLADNAARAAANHSDKISAQHAAQQAIDDFVQNNNYGSIVLNDFNYDLGNEQITLITQMNIKLPVPFGTWDTMTVSAQAVQPILATPAPI